MALLRDFSGGVNTRIAPHLLNENQAQEYVNIDSASGILQSLKGPVSTGIPVLPYYTYFYADDEWVSKDIETDFVEYQDVLYMSNGDVLKYRKNLVETPLGIAGPTEPLSVGKAKDLVISIATADTGTLVVGNTYNYVLEIYDNVSQEWFYKELSYTIDITTVVLTKKVVFTFSDISEAGTYTLTLYRQYANELKLVGAVTYSSGITITDSVLNIGVAAGISDKYGTEMYTYCYTFYNSVNNIESTPSLPSSEVSRLNTLVSNFQTTTNSSVDKIRIYRNGGILTNYTLIEELDYTGTLTSYHDNLSDIELAGNHILDSFNNSVPLTGLKYLTEAYAMLFAAKGDKLYFSEIAKPYAWPATNFLDFDADITGIGAVSSGLLVFTKYKTFIVTGNSPLSFSKYLLSSSQGCITHRSVQFIDNNLIWLSNDGICSTNGGQITVPSMSLIGKIDFMVNVYSSAVLDGIYYLSYSNALGDKLLVLDFRYNLIIRYMTTQGTHILATLDNLYQNYNNTLQRLLSGDELEITYKSALLTEGKYSNYKTYKDMYIKYNGTFTVQTYIDGNLTNSVDLTGNDMYNLKFKGLSKGYGLEIKIVGTGTIEEIDYEVVGRQNGK